jgi:tetratricopeptide (TPR) repeat protein
MDRRHAVLALLATLWTPLFSQTAGVWEHAYDLYQATNYEGSLAALAGVKTPDSATLQLRGQAYYMLGEYKKATDSLEAACRTNSESSACWHWLARAYGRRAETANPFAAPGYASKTRQYLEKAVELDPVNREAVGDLFDYYLEAPGFLGGGEKKAEALAAKMTARDAAEGHYYQAQLAERRKEFDTAEQHLRSAVQLAPKQVGRFIDLAKFLAVRGRTKEADALFDQAAQVAPASPRVIFERAATYIKTMRNLLEARRLLQQYLRSNITPEDPPRADAEAMLKKIGGA